MSARPFAVYDTESRTILSRTSGFIAEAGFTHSLNPARNCTFACTYCYVPTMRVQAGLKPEDWRRWGQFTTFKSNAAELLRRELKRGQRIYCSPLVDPYQPAEQSRRLMPDLLHAVIEHPPEVFVVQTRGPMVARDIDLLKRLAARTTLRVSFSLTTDREDVRRWYEPHCASLDERFQAMRDLLGEGIDVWATLAPILPCNPEALAEKSLSCSSGDMVADPLHSRANKPGGATTFPPAERISEVRGFGEWHQIEFQAAVLARLAKIVESAGRRFGAGPRAFAWLSTPRTT